MSEGRMDGMQWRSAAIDGFLQWHDAKDGDGACLWSRFAAPWRGSSKQSHPPGLLSGSTCCFEGR